MKTYHESICPLGIGLPSFWLLFSQPALVLHIVQASNKMLSQKESKFHSDLFGVDLRFFPCHTCLILGWDWRTDWEIESAMKAFGQRAASIHHMDPEGGKFSVCWLNNRIQKVKQKKKKKQLDEVDLECARSRPLLPLSGSATAQTRLWFGAPGLAHFPNRGKLATILARSWVCRDLEKLFLAFEKLESKPEEYPRGWIPKMSEPGREQLRSEQKEQRPPGHVEL